MIESLNASPLQVAASWIDASNVLRLHFHGQCTDRYPHRTLTPYLTQALSYAAEHQAGIELDFQQLSFVNSSAITVIVRFLRDAHKKAVQLVLCFDPKITWQKITCDAVRALGEDDPLLVIKNGPQ